VPEPINSIEEYIATCPAEVQPILDEIRRVIRRAAPESEETISYRMPTFTMDGKYLVYVSAWKHHIGVYPIPRLDGPSSRRSPDIGRPRTHSDSLSASRSRTS
jgi:uncharacterized protein YdhG (YjbR/CyaY superfamily)